MCVCVQKYIYIYIYTYNPYVHVGAHRKLAGYKSISIHIYIQHVSYDVKRMLANFCEVDTCVCCVYTSAIHIHMGALGSSSDQLGVTRR